MTVGSFGTSAGSFAPGTDARAAPEMTGASFGLPLIVGDEGLVNLAISSAVTYFVPIEVPTARSVDAFVFIAGSANLTNDAEFGLYEIDTTGVKLGTKLAGATQTSSFTADTYTEITFSSVSLSAAWYFIGISGISAAAGPDMRGWDLVVSGQSTSNPLLGFIDSGLTSVSNIGWLQGTGALDTISVGAALTPTQGGGVPILRLRNG